MDLIRKIQKSLIDYYEYKSWKNFVDNQELGECQGIISYIKYEFPQVTTVFGEIKVDEPYIDEDGEEQILMTHHWVKFRGEIYDFSKGSLSRYIEWGDIYEVNDGMDDWRYFGIRRKGRKNG